MSEKDKYNILNSIKRNEKLNYDRDTQEILDYLVKNGYVRKYGDVYQITEKGREFMDEF